MKHDIIIFSDGASKGNPGKGGWGAVVVVDKKVTELGGSIAHTTNNKMELTGAIKALENIASKQGRKHEDKHEDKHSSIIIYTDSRYVINGITKWISDWKKRDWKTLQKDDVANRDLWEDLDSLVLNFDGKISWHYVGGHIGIIGNERVDEIATDFADGGKVKLFSGTLSDYGRDILNISFDEVKKEIKNIDNSRKSRSRRKAYSYVSRVDGQIKTHKTWAECESRVKGISSAKFKKALSPSEEKIIISEWSK